MLNRVIKQLAEGATNLKSLFIDLSNTAPKEPFKNFILIPNLEHLRVYNVSTEDFGISFMDVFANA